VAGDLAVLSQTCPPRPTTLNAQEARARAVINGERAAKSTRFVKIHAGARSLDEASLARAQSLVGLKGYVTNIGVDVMPAVEVIAKYHGLWHVERSFRMSKSDLRARPMFHRTRDAIEAHLTIVFAALAVAHCIQERTGLAIANVVKQLRSLRSATIVINGVTETFPPEIPAPQRKILASLGRKNPRQHPPTRCDQTAFDHCLASPTPHEAHRENNNRVILSKRYWG
jgi:hypothetical protein